MTSRGRNGLKWYLARLSVMRPAEILHRMSEQIVLKKMHLRFFLDYSGKLQLPTSSFCTSSQQQLPSLPWCVEFDDAQVKELLDGKIRVMSWEWQWKAGKKSWHVAPDTGKQWPSGFFGSIAYRPGNEYGDVRVAWEPSRLQQLVTLALIATHKEDVVADRAVSVLEDMFLDWVADNEIMNGIHYISAMECALRIIACCHAFDLVRNSLNKPEITWRALNALVYEHACYIENRLSLYSSANNHLICEAAGLVYAGVLFPELSRAKKWHRLGVKILEKEADRQILADGGSAEQTFWYQRLVTDIYSLVDLLLKHHNCSKSGAIASGAERAREFLNVFSKKPDDIPAIGDCDNGYALSPYLELSWLDTEAYRRQGKSFLTFDNAGYTLIQNEEVMQSIIFDHGPLGLAPTYVHGHSDALSILMRIGEDKVLIDPGTCTYSGDIESRSYFRSARAHNTVVVDGLDQAVQETRFMWSSPYNAKLVWSYQTNDGKILLLANHDGYYSRKGVMHWRGLVYLPSSAVIVLDLVTGQGEHDLEINWHLGTDVSSQDNGSWSLFGFDKPVSIKIEGSEVKLYKAGNDLEDQAGWYSPVYGTREAICTLRSSVNTALPFEFLTTIKIGESTESDLLDVENELDLLRNKIYETKTH